jgi:hypothetical protein
MTTAYLTRSKATLLVDNDVDGGHGPAATATTGRNNSSSSMNKQTSVGQSQPQMISLRRSNSSPETDRSSTIYNNKGQSNNNNNNNNNNVDIQDLINVAIDATTNNPTLHIPGKLRSCLSGSRLNEMYGSSSSSSAADQSSQRPMKRNVSFGHIHIREHPVVLGDNPAVSTGPALSLGWFDGGHDDGDCHENEDDGNNRTNKSSSSLEFQIPVDEYEKERQHGGSAPRRSATHQLVLSREERQRILQTEAGVTMNDIRKIETEINKIKRSRRKTNEQSSKQQRRRKSTGCGDTGGGGGSGCAASVVGNSIVSTFDGVWKKIKSGTTSSGAGTTSSQRELDELMYRSALAEKVRREQELQELQRHLQKQPCKFKAYGGTDAPPTVPQRGGRRPQLVVGGDDSFSSRADSDEDDQSSCRDRRHTVPLSTLSHSSSEPFLVLLNSTTSCSNESNELVDGAVSSDNTDKKALGGSGKKAADDDGDDDGTDSTSESDSEEEEEDDDDDDDDNDDDDCDYYVEDDLAKDLAAIIASRATPNDRKGKSEATVIADASTSDNDDDDDDDDEPFMF